MGGHIEDIGSGFNTAQECDPWRFHQGPRIQIRVTEVKRQFLASYYITVV